MIPEKDICDDCWVHILVYGYETTRYSILASFVDGTITLFNGLPQGGSVSSENIQYYSYAIQSSCTVTTILTVFSGDIAPALHISSTIDHPTGNTPNTIHRISGTGSVEEGEGSVGLLPRLDFLSGTKGEWIYIGVDGAGHNATYSIRVYETPDDTINTLPTLLVLPIGKPQEDEIKSDTLSKWLYYQIQAPLGHDALKIRFMVEVGSIDLYITQCIQSDITKCDTSSSTLLPSTTNYLYTTAGHPDRTYLTIERNDPKTSIYLLGVKSTSFYSAYQLSASFESSILSLQAGIAVLDHVNIGGGSYFSFFLNQQPFVTIKIALTVISGDPDLFISLTSNHPGPGNSTWRSALFGADTITIDPTHDSQACRQCTYYIAVLGALESTFTILVSTSSNIPKLNDGIPSIGYINAYDWVYYSFHNIYAVSRDIHISLVSQTGNADVYVTLDGSMPSLINYVYGSAKWSSTDELTILHSDGGYQSACVLGTIGGSQSGKVNDCVIIVGVYGASTGDYTVTLTTSSSAKLLQLGVVNTDTVAYLQSNYYRVLVNEDYGSDVPSTIRYSLNIYSGHIDVYVSCKSMQPNITNSQWYLTSQSPGDEVFLDVFSATAIDQGCHITQSGSGLKYIYLYTAIEGGTSAARYSIMASILEEPIVPLLHPGIAIPTKQILTQSIDYYFIRPAPTYDNMHILTSVLSGHIDIYISASWDSKPFLDSSNTMIQSYLLKKINIRNGDILLRNDWFAKNCMNRMDCYFIIAVINIYESSSQYSIQVSLEDSAILLTTGIPRISHVDAKHFQYFIYSLTQPGLDVTIAVTPIKGDPGK